MAVAVVRVGRAIAAIIVALPGAHALAADDGSASKPAYRWAASPHGKMLERILPPAITPAQLPEPQSEGAHLTAQYCVQCHHLPSPAMHTAARWTSVVDRMVWRMRGEGNLGVVMKEMMADVETPAPGQVATLLQYLQKHGQKEMNPADPALRTEAGKMFSIACTQCHALPDPQRHTAREWPGVVKRMRAHLAWFNTVVGDPALRTTPELNTAKIVRFLQAHAREPGSRQ